MDIELINQFRDIVNSEGFTFFWYRAKSEINLWNCICSAMDWITVSVEHISAITPEIAKKMRSIDVYAYISCIDIIVESVQQLHRVIHNTNDLLFKDDSEIFAGNQFNQSDLRYFKTLRSCFGAHPVNLSEPGDEQNKEMRRFASWSSNLGRNGTASVVLYSNQHKSQNIFLSIDLQQILRFGNKYYKYLMVLGESLCEQYKDFVQTKRSERIVLPDNPVDQLDVLLAESKQRLDNDVYRSDIQELKFLFSVEVTAKENMHVVQKYRKALLVLIDEIYNHLQNMDITDLEYDDLLYPSPKGMPNGWGYWREKITEYVFGEGYPPMLWEPQIRDLIAPYIKLEYSSCDELFLLMQAALYSLKVDESEKQMLQENENQ